MLFTIEQNAKYLNNFALLTLASDLLYLRITLKKSTITTLLSCVEYESLNLVGKLIYCLQQGLLCLKRFLVTFGFDMQTTQFSI